MKYQPRTKWDTAITWELHWRNCSTDHTRNANTTCGWSTSNRKKKAVAAYRRSSLPLFCDVLPFCPNSGPPRHHCSTVQWVMGIANHWQSEFPSQPYTRRQLWRSARIYSLPLSPAGCPRSFLPSYPQSAPPQAFHILRGRDGRINRLFKTLDIVSSGDPVAISNVIIRHGWEFDNRSLCPTPWGPFTSKKKTNCAANSLGGLLVQSKEGLLHLIR